MKKETPAAESTPSADLPAVLLIHGTFAFHEEDVAGSDTKNRWWLRDSTFCDAINAAMGQGGKCVPKGNTDFRVLPWWRRSLTGVVGWMNLLLPKGPVAPVPLDTNLAPDAVFHWSGDNSESARRNTGKLLLEHLQRFDALGRKFHVIAHSHGGSALWEALCQSVTRISVAPTDLTQRREWESKLPLKNLASWTTVGTPYMQFAPDWRRLISIVPLAATAYVTWRQWDWFRDFWEEYPPANNLAWQWKAFAFAWSCATCLFLVVLLLRFLFALYRNRESTKNACLEPSVRKREQDDLWSTVLGCISVAMFLAAGLIPNDVRASLGTTTVLGWTVPRFWAAMVSPSFGHLALTWFVLAMSMLYYFGTSLLAPFWQWWNLMKRTRLQKIAWDGFGKRLYCLALASHDEPIVALRAASKGFQGELLPRFPSPLVSDFSEPKGRRLRRPEREFDRQSLCGWAFHYVLLPIAIIRDWVIYPIYNEVFVSLIDQFVFEQMCNRAAGCDIAGLRPNEVLDHPFPLAERSVCPAQVEEQLLAAINGGAEGFLKHFRERVFRFDSPVAMDLTGFITEAMQGAPANAALLVHTSYFDSPALRTTLATHIVSGQLNEEAPAPTSVPFPVQSCRKQKGFADVLLGFVAFVCQLAVVAALLCAPAALVYFFGWHITYPYSREYLEDWASRPELPLDLATDFPIGVRVQSADVEPVVRWFVACKLLNPALQEAHFANRVGNGNSADDARNRIYFYAKLGQTYAKIDRKEWAISALQLAVNELSGLEQSHEDNTNQNICDGLVMAALYLGFADNELDKLVFDNAIRNEYLERNRKMLHRRRTTSSKTNPAVWLEEIEKYRDLRIAKRANPAGDLDWMLAEFREKVKVAPIVKARARGMAFCLSRAPEFAAPEELYVKAFIEALQELRRDAADEKKNDPQTRVAMLSYGLDAIVGVEACVPAEKCKSRTMLIDEAYLIQKAIVQTKEPVKGHVKPMIQTYQDREFVLVKADLAIARLLRGSGFHEVADQLMAERKTSQLYQSKPVKVRNAISTALIVEHARRREVFKAKALADNSLPEVRIEAAIQTLIVEFERRSHGESYMTAPRPDAIQRALSKKFVQADDPVAVP